MSLDYLLDYVHIEGRVRIEVYHDNTVVATKSFNTPNLADETLGLLGQLKIRAIHPNEDRTYYMNIELEDKI